MMSMNKTVVDRDFLYQAALKNKGWYEKPMRYGNLTWVENDPVNYDIDWWVDFLKETHTQCITLSVGGIVAYYPTQIPLHHRSDWLGDRDMVGEFIMKCRENNINVIARIDPHAFRDDMAQAHPEWVSVDYNGRKLRHWDNKSLWVACTNGGYVFDYLNEINKEIMTMYMPDAIFSNRYEGSGICYCESCRNLFREEYGMELPAPDNTDPNDPQRAAYDKWHEKLLFDRWNFWDSEIKKINPNAIFSPNVGGGTMAMMNLYDLGKRAERINIDKQGRNAGLEALWSIGRYGKKFTAIFGDKPVAGGYSVGPEWRYRWKDAVQSIPELKLLYANGLASGMHPSWGKFSGKLYDWRWVKPVKEIFKWHYQNEKYLRNTHSLANVGLLYSQPHIWRFSEGSHIDSHAEEDHALGMYHALTEARIPFDLIHSDLISEEILNKYKAVILPNTMVLSDEKCELIRSYVGKGGSLIATFESALYDQSGSKRKNFGLADIFGADYIETMPGPIINGYINIEKSAGGSFHPLVEGIEDAGRIINGPWQMKVKKNTDILPPPLTLIPAYPSLPMEDVFPREPHTDIPWVYLQERGESRIAYFPWDIDRMFWETLSEDHFKLLRNTVMWALRGDLPARVIGQGMVDVAVWKQEKSVTVHIVNMTNPMMWKGPCRELLPLSGQSVEIKLPDGMNPKGVHLLKSRLPVDFSEADGKIIINLPEIFEHEIVAFDF